MGLRTQRAENRTSHSSDLPVIPEPPAGACVQYGVDNQAWRVDQPTRGGRGRARIGRSVVPERLIVGNNARTGDARASGIRRARSTVTATDIVPLAVDSGTSLSTRGVTTR